MSADALADLGLDFADTPVAADVTVKAPVEEKAKEVPAEVPAEVETEKKKRSPRETVDIGTPTFAKAVGIPGIRRVGGGATGSKYPFATLKAPVANADGDFEYDTFTLTVQEGVDPEKLKRAVQQAVSGENRKEKEDGTKIRYATRTVLTDGVLTGAKVYRVDDTLDDEDDDKASS